MSNGRQPSERKRSMSMPGFTAESSLYRGSMFRAHSLLSNDSLKATAIVPQQVKQRIYAFLDEDGCACKGVEDYERGRSYVKGCIC
jgi:hypothetical protein